MTTMTRSAYCARLDEICDAQEAGRISVAEMDRRLDAFKAATTVIEDAPVTRPPAGKPAVPVRRAPGVTLTRDQLAALVTAGIPPPRRPAAESSAAAAALREKHDRAITTVLAAIARPASLTQSDLGMVLLEAGGAVHRSPFYETQSPAPDAQPAPMTAHEMAALPMEEFLAVGASRLAASTQHASPFYRRAASR